MKKMIYGAAGVLSVCVLCVCLRFNPIYYAFISWNTSPLPEKVVSRGGITDPNAYIAHGGGVKQFVYTNSKEALEDSIRKKFYFVELDMVETLDHHILAAHDWEYFRKKTGSQDGKKAMSLAEARSLKINGSFTPLSGNEIAEYMSNYPDLFLVTDKIKNYELLLKEIPFPNRMIVEVFSIKDYVRALRAGVKYPALCVGKSRERIMQAMRHNIKLVTMEADKRLFSENLGDIKRFHDNGGVILLFYVNFSDADTYDFLNVHLGKTFTKIYTNRWSPASLPE